MGNRRLYKIEHFHTLGTSESERLKVTALNLFHPTASPRLPQRSVSLYCDTVSVGGELHSTGYLIKGVLQGGSYKWGQDETFNIGSFIFQLDQTHVQMSYLSGPLAVVNYEETTGVVLR